MITLEQAKQLTHGTTLHHTIFCNADGTPVRWRVNGQPKTWKRSPERVQVPVKNGLYSYDYITETCLDLVALTPQEAMGGSNLDGYTLKYLTKLPTIEQGHFDNLKIDTGSIRVWLSRMTVADGQPYDNMVTVEKLINGTWQEFTTYQAREG